MMELGEGEWAREIPVHLSLELGKTKWRNGGGSKWWDDGFKWWG